MTAPVDINAIIPSKAKTWVGLVGSLLTFVVPFILSAEQYLPSPWPAVIGGVIAVLTALGIYKAPYSPQGTTLAVDPTATTVSSSVPVNAPVAVSAANTPVVPTPPPVGGWRNQWKK